MIMSLLLDGRRSLQNDDQKLEASSVLVEYVLTFSPGLNFPRAHCYNTCQCPAARPMFIKLLRLGEEIVGKVYKRKRTDRDRKTDRQTDSCCCWRRLLRCLHQCH